MDDDFGSPYRSVCQIVDADGTPAKATLTSNLWEMDDTCFSHKTEGNLIQHFTTGAEYYDDFISACSAAESEICIVGWQINWDALLKDGIRLYDVLRQAVENGTMVYVLPWCHSNPVQTYDYQTQIVLEQMNKELGLAGKQKRVHVARAASRAKNNVRYFSHHQKQVIIDRKIAYVGGIDLCYGRFDDATYDLHAGQPDNRTDHSGSQPGKTGRQVMNRYNPCIPPQQALSADAPMLADPDLMSGISDRNNRGSVVPSSPEQGQKRINLGTYQETSSQAPDLPSNLEQNQKKIDQGAWQVPYKEVGTFDVVVNKASVDSNSVNLFTLDPARQPRMPWQDVHCRIEGPAVSDLLRNFVVRWNSTASDPKLPQPPSPAEYEKKGKAHLQVLRSAPQPMVAAEAKLQGNPNAEHQTTEDHIQRAMLRLIEKASSFIYIENQFFVSAFGEQVPAPSPDLSPAAQYINTYYGSNQNASAQKAAWFDADKRWFSADLAELTAPPQNAICRALIQRIRRAIFDITKPDFHVYITLPVHPEGELAKASVAVQVYWTMQSLVHGSHSLINGTRRALKARDYLDKNPRCEPRAALQWADELPVSELDPDDERWKNYLTLLNLRNWEKLGERYVTEQIYVHSKLMIVDDLYALLGSANINDRSLLGTRDSELAVLIMDGENTLADLCGNGGQKPVRLFAHDLRKAIWKKLFGITGGVRPASELQSAIDAPASPKSWQAIQERAEKNAKAYEAAFPFVPRNWFVGTNRIPETAKIIPNWDQGRDNPKNAEIRGYPATLLPFEPEFWDAPQHDPKGVAQLEGIRGFITALPIHWIEGENVRFDFPSSLVTKDEPRATEGKTLMSEADVGIGRG